MGEVESMNTEITNLEAIELTQKLQSDICSLLCAYRCATGLTPKTIKIRFLELVSEGMEPQSLVTSVEVKVVENN